MSTDPWGEYISIDEVKRLHAQGIDQYGGLHSPPISGCVEGAIGNAYTAGLYGIGEAEPTPVAIALVFAGHLLFYLARDHCFTEGNKRVAWTSCTHVLACFGLTIIADENEAFLLCDEIINRELNSGHEVVEWIADRLTSVEDLPEQASKN
jgi:death on curing protein